MNKSKAKQDCYDKLNKADMEVESLKEKYLKLCGWVKHNNGLGDHFNGLWRKTINGKEVYLTQDKALFMASHYGL